MICEHVTINVGSSFTNCNDIATVFIFLKLKKYNWPSTIAFCERHWLYTRMYNYNIVNDNYLIITEEKYIKYKAML